MAAISSAKVRAAALKAFQAIGDIKETITYTKLTLGIYDTETGIQAITPANLTMTVAVLTLDEDERKDFPAPDQVRRVLIPYAYLQGAGHDPDLTDYMTIDGLVYAIKRFKVLPTQAVTKFYVESP